MCCRQRAVPTWQWGSLLVPYPGGPARRWYCSDACRDRVGLGRQYWPRPRGVSARQRRREARIGWCGARPTRAA